MFHEPSAQWPIKEELENSRQLRIEVPPTAFQTEPLP